MKKNLVILATMAFVACSKNDDVTTVKVSAGIEIASLPPNGAKQRNVLFLLDNVIPGQFRKDIIVQWDLYNNSQFVRTVSDSLWNEYDPLSKSTSKLSSVSDVTSGQEARNVRIIYAVSSNPKYQFSW